MQCKFTKPEGEQCKANAMADSDYCFHHNPDIPDEVKREAQAKGGRAKQITITKPLPELPIVKSKDIFYLIADTLKRVRSGEIDPKIANTIFYGSEKLLKAYETKTIEKKIEKLEKPINI